jgi:hypothetical protein
VGSDRGQTRGLGETRFRAPTLWCGAPSSAARAHARWKKATVSGRPAPPVCASPLFKCAPGQRNRHRHGRVRIRKEKSHKAVKRPEAHGEGPFPLPLPAARNGPCCRPLGIETHGRPMAGAENDGKTGDRHPQATPRLLTIRPVVVVAPLCGGGATTGSASGVYGGMGIADS